MKNKFFRYFIFTMFLFFSFILFLYFPYVEAYPKLINKIISAFQKIKSYIVGIATPAVAVSIGCGFMMQKFSFGDEEIIRTGKKIIRSSLFSYAFFLAIDLILSAVQTLVK